MCFPSPSAAKDNSIVDLRNYVILFWEIGAGEGIRTLDPDLGKVVLYP